MFVIDRIRDNDELLKLYQDRALGILPIDYILSDRLKNTNHIYGFYEKINSSQNLFGVIYFDESESKLFLNGFCKGKHFKEAVLAVETVCNYYKQDIYADTEYKHAVLVLTRAGFKHLEGNIYIRRYLNGER